MKKFLAKIRRIINPYSEIREFNKEPRPTPILPSASASSSPHTYNFSEIPNLSYDYDGYWGFYFNINGQNVLEQFELKFSYTPQILQKQEDLEEPGEEFAWGRISIFPGYKRKKIMSFVMLNIILCILRSEKEKNICFRLGNTSYEIDPQNKGKGMNLKIYDSILTQYDNNYQYEIYPIKSRKEDIESIKSKLIQIKKHLSEQFPNVNF